MQDSTEFEEYARTVQISCWIQGLYIFRALAKETDSVAYYGITKDIDEDGMVDVDGTKTLCKTFNKIDGRRNEDCKPMEKTFFIQVCIISVSYTHLTLPTIYSV